MTSSPVPLLALPEPIVGMPRSGMITEIPTPSEWRRDLADYMAWQRAAGRPETTVKIRGYHLRRFATAADCAPYEVTLDMLVDHLGCDRWSAHTRRSVRSSLRSFYNWAHVTGRASQNAAGLLPPISTPPGRPRPAPVAAVQRGMVNLDPRVTLMVQLGDQVGMRCCEIARSHTRDVIGVYGHRSLVVHGKGNKDREVPIGDRLAQQLLDRDAGYIFPGQVDGHLSAGYVSKLISRAMSGLATGHQLRHKFASEALRRAGGNLRVVQELLGHSSVATTQIYTAVDDDELRRAAIAA